MSHDLHCELHRHATALRGLARDLLRDGHAADDVTQATLQQALARPALQPGPLGGWLHRTLVNFARQWRRGERRRLLREAALPVRAPEPGVAETLMRRELLQGVTDAVLRLDEPFQTAVFLRYFEDLPPRAIAKRTGTNVATVKSRLARGLVMLRTRLDAATGRRDTWRAGLALTFGLPLGGSFLPLPTGTLLVSSTTKIVFAATALCVGGLFAYGLGGDPPPEAARVETRTDASTAATVSAPQPEQPTAAERQTPASHAAPAPWLEHPFTMQMELAIVDETGLPVAGQSLQVAPVGCALNLLEGSTGDDGRVAFSFPSRQRELTVEIGEPRGGLRRIALQHDRVAKVTLLGKPRVMRGNFRVRLGTKLSSGSREKATAVFVDSLLVDGSSKPLGTGPGLHPHARFSDPSMKATAAAAAGADLELAITDVQGLSFTAVLERVSFATSELKWTTAVGDLTKLAGEQPPNAVAGTVFGADGKPAKSTLVVLLGAGPQPLQQIETDEHGQFRFDGVKPGSYTVRAGGAAAGLATQAVAVTQGTTPATLQLQHGQCVRGVVRDANGDPVPDAALEWRALDGSWCDGTKSGKDGAFTFANLPAGPGTVLVFDASGELRLPIATAPAVLPDTGELLLTRSPTSGKLVFEPVGIDAENGRVPAEVRVWNSETGLGTVVSKHDDAPAWTVPALPPGTHELELRTTFAGRVRRDGIWHDGVQPIDLGRVELPRGGSIRIALAAADLPVVEQRAFEIASLRPDVDVRLHADELPLDRVVQLPAGAYVFAYRHADGGVRFVRFTVRAGEETVVRADA